MYSLNNISFKIIKQVSEIDGAIFDTFQKRGSYSWLTLYHFLRCQPEDLRKQDFIGRINKNNWVVE